MAFTKIAAAGIGSTETVTLHSLEVLNNATVGGVLTYEDVTNVDSVGLITARAGIVVGSGITLSKDGDGFFTGIVTATTFSGTFSGDGTSLTGVASTDNIRTNTNATFLQNINVSGTTTAAGNINVSGANITLQDSGSASDDRLAFGAGTDFMIYHNGTSNVINNTTKELHINGTSEHLAKFIPDGAVELYHNNSKKFETTSAGVTVTGHLTVGTATLYSTGNLLLGDSDEIRFGDGEDLKIYHDGSNSYIDNDTGYLYLRSNYLALRSASSENYMIAETNGSVQLYYDNSKKFETASHGATFFGTSFHGDNIVSAFGASSDLQLYHNGTNSYIDNHQGDLYIRGDSDHIVLQAVDDESSIVCDPNGAVNLYYDNSLKLATSNTGVTVTGTVAATSYTGDGSNLTGIEAGITTEAASISGITTYLDLTKDDHELFVSGTNTISVIGGAQGTSHSLRIQNSATANITLDSTYFKFPSGATPALPTASGAISMISFTVHKAGAVGVNTVLLGGASVSFS